MFTDACVTDWLTAAGEEIDQDVSDIEAQLHRLESQTPISAGSMLERLSSDRLDLLDELESGPRLDVRYRGELPRHGFLGRIGEGLRQVYTVLKTLSLFGGAIGFDRAASSVVISLAVLFFASILYTYSSWKRQDAERLSKNLDTAREGGFGIPPMEQKGSSNS